MIDSAALYDVQIHDQIYLKIRQHDLAIAVNEKFDPSSKEDAILVMYEDMLTRIGKLSR